MHSAEQRPADAHPGQWVLIAPALCFTKTVKLDIGRSHKGSLSMERKGKPQTVVFGQAGKQLLEAATDPPKTSDSEPLFTKLRNPSTGKFWN
ncbi:hypothetical protein Q9233_014567 [Columba guinea]|nr:hypothetical protein Q9233_014567 [Columba guinea]